MTIKDEDRQVTWFQAVQDYVQGKGYLPYMHVARPLHISKPLNIMDYHEYGKTKTDGEVNNAKPIHTGQSSEQPCVVRHSKSGKTAPRPILNRQLKFDTATNRFKLQQSIPPKIRWLCWP